MLYGTGWCSGLFQCPFRAYQKTPYLYGACIDYTIHYIALTGAKAEYDPRHVRTGNYLTAQLLQGIHGFASGSKRLFELSESNRSSMINNARNMGLFRMHRLNYPSSDAGSLEQQWEVWIHAERLRRIAWAIYVSCGLFFSCYVSMKLADVSTSSFMILPARIRATLDRIYPL